MDYIKPYSINEFSSIDEYLSLYAKKYKISKRILKKIGIDNLNTLNHIVNNEKVSKINFELLLQSLFSSIDFNIKIFDPDQAKKITNNVLSVFNLFENKELSNLTEEERLSVVKIFFRVLPTYVNTQLSYYLFTSKGMRKSSLLNEYFANNLATFYDSSESIKKLINIYEKFAMYDEHYGTNLIEKLDYVFNGCDDLLYIFSRDYLDSFEKSFRICAFQCFSKETLNNLFQVFIGNENLYRFLDFNDKKFYMIVSEMSDYMLSICNHDTTLFDNLLYYFSIMLLEERDQLVEIIDDYYDKRYPMAKVDGVGNDPVFQKLLGFILDLEYGVPNKFYIGFNVRNINDFVNDKLGVNSLFDNLYINTFGEDDFKKMKKGDFTLSKPISFYYKLKSTELETLALERLFGISLKSASIITDIYGNDIMKSKDEISDDYQDILEILKSIKRICDVDSKEKFEELMNILIEHIKEHGIYPEEGCSSYPILIGMLNRMFMDSYSKVLYNPTADSRVLYYYKDTVPVIDASVEFNMLINATDCISSYYDDSLVKTRLRYNSSRQSDNQGICCSFISNENLGLITLNRPLLAYANLGDDALVAMGTGDIYSDTSRSDMLLYNNKKDNGHFFYTPKALIDNSRFGYNEVVINRFIRKDPNNEYKVQPSYVVAFKIDDDYESTKHYRYGLKMAKDFGIPLVLIDVTKVKEHEKQVIKEMEDKLFSSNKVDEELVKKIITRYMNNYTGSFTMNGECNLSGNGWTYQEDFSIKALSNFLNRVEEHFAKLDFEELNEWHDALTNVYEQENEKNRKALAIKGFASSIKNEFLLRDTLHFDEVINKAYHKYSRIKLKDLNPEDLGSVNCSNCNSLAYKELINFVNFLLPKSYLMHYGHNDCEYSDVIIFYRTLTIKELSEEDKSTYDLVLSYLFGDYNNHYFSDLINAKIDDINLSDNVSDINCPIKQMTPLLSDLITKIESMNKSDFMDRLTRTTMYSAYFLRDDYERYSQTLLERKENIRHNLENLIQKDKTNQKVKRV